MNRYLLLGSVLLLLIIILGIAAFVAVTAHKQTAANPSPNFPVATTTAASAHDQMTVALQNGQSIRTADFLHNGKTIQDPQNAGQYYLAGSVGYCDTNGSCPGGAPSDEYHIVYFSEDKSFIISLVAEPIGQARRDAEQFLMQTLGLTQQQMCALKYEVLTTSSVNGQFAGDNLGFSFCPGATKLP